MENKKLKSKSDHQQVDQSSQQHVPTKKDTLKSAADHVRQPESGTDAKRSRKGYYSRNGHGGYQGL